MAAEHFQAVFVDTATTPASTLRVKIPGFDDGVGTFVVVWAPLGNALPAVGDQALVVEADDGTWWAVSWESAAQTMVDVTGPYVFTARVVGTWPTSTPGATTGTHIVLPRTGPVLIDVGATGYVTTGGIGIAIQVWIDGVNVGSMVLNPTIATVDRRALGPCKISPTLAAGDHYIALKQTSGTSDASDYADIAVLQP